MVAAVRVDSLTAYQLGVLGCLIPLALLAAWLAGARDISLDRRLDGLTALLVLILSPILQLATLWPRPLRLAQGRHGLRRRRCRPGRSLVGGPGEGALHLVLVRLQIRDGLGIVAGHLLLVGPELLDVALQICEIARDRLQSWV